jgi:hypothetical protein
MVRYVIAQLWCNGLEMYAQALAQPLQVIAAPSPLMFYGHKVNGLMIKQVIQIIRVSPLFCALQIFHSLQEGIWNPNLKVR